MHSCLIDEMLDKLINVKKNLRPSIFSHSKRDIEYNIAQHRQKHFGIQSLKDQLNKKNFTKMFQDYLDEREEQFKFCIHLQNANI